MKARDAGHTTTAVSRRSGTVVLVLVFLGGLINYMDRAVMGVLAPLISLDLGLDASRLGLAFGMFSVGYGALTLVGGWASDRYGPRPVLGLSMLAWSILCGLTGTVSGFWSLLTVRTAFGAGESPWVPASNKMLSQVVHSSRFGTVFGLASAGQPIGGAIAGPLIAIAALGWRLSFALVAAIGLAWVCAWWVLTSGHQPDRPASAVVRGGPAKVLQQPTSPVRLRRVLTGPAVLSTCFSIMAVTYAQTFFLSWFPSYLTVARHLAQPDMALVSGIPWILGAAGFACGGFLSDYAARKLPADLLGRRILLSACLLPAGVCIALVPLVDSTQVSIALMSAAVGFLYLGGPNYFATIHEVVPPQCFGSAVGLLAFFSTIAGFLAPTITGLVVRITATYTLAFAATAAFLLAALVVFTTCARSPRSMHAAV